MVDKKLSEFDEVSNGDVSFFPVLDNNTKNGKLAATKAMPWTNCITEISQDVNLTLSSGTLTLKAGSKVYVPNGSGVFNAITISNDLSTGGVANRNTMLFYINGSLQRMAKELCFSGDTAPILQGSLAIWYDTANNLIKYTDNGGSTWKANNISLPICIATETTGGFTSINQIFNGFGFIGSTVFALPGVKGLIPNGRNADGTLKNTSFTISSVISETRQDYGTYVRTIKLGSSYMSGFALNNYMYDYDGNRNYESGTLRNYAVLGRLVTTSNKIDSFTMPEPFHAVDYSEFKEMISAIDQDTMKLTGAQSYSGIKTATTVNGIQATVSGNNNILQVNTAANLTDTTRNANYTNTFAVNDKNGLVASQVGTTFRTDGGVKLYMQARNRSTGSQVTGEINVMVDKDGNVITYAPTPATNDNSTKISTTQWFNNKVKQVSTLPANPTAGVYYFVTE